MYPSGIGTSFVDPRRSNFTKSQSLGYNSGRRTAKDFAETTANANPHPTDPLGTNLRRGKGLSFSRGIAQFDGYIKGNGMQDNSAFAPPGPSYAPPPHVTKRPTFRNMSAGSRSSFQQHEGDSSSRPQSGQVSFRPGSAKAANGAADEFPVGSADSSLQEQLSARQSSRPGTAGHVSGGRFRPHSAPVKRPEIRQEDLPAWARDQLFVPSWAKTVEDQKRRPNSAARLRQQQQALPLSSIPKWISLDNKMLSFEAFFKEAVEESRQERFRVRRCVVQYYLEDDTIKISEPREENSGMPQGSFLKRHKVPKDGGGFVNWRDIRVPGDLQVYRRTFRVTKCDAFTREFLQKAGVEVAVEAVPLDDVHAARSRPASGRPTSAGSVKSWAGDSVEFYGRQKNDMSEYVEARLGRCQDKKALVTKYLDNDRKVLRFYCSWDETSPDGVVEKRPFVLHFFLADDTVEVLEVAQPNSGRDPFPTLLKRMRLPRGSMEAGVTAGAANSTASYVAARDLRVGGVVSVFGRQMEINDCDEATARYYREEYGVQWEARQAWGARGARVTSAGARPRSGVLVPPHNGFGAEEDSRQNCISLHPKPPKVNVIRLLENKGKLLRFVGKLEHAVGFDVERVFTITYFLDTDEIAIFEPPVKNSGRTGGKFMERCRVRKPRSSDYYSEADLYLGARIGVYSRRFVLVDADEFTVKYMEGNPQVFPFSDVNRIAALLEEADLEAVGAALRQRDKLAQGEVRVDDFKSVLRAAAAGGQARLSLNDQEVHTLVRALGSRGGVVKYEGMLSGEALAPGRAERRSEQRRGAKTVAIAGSGDPELDAAVAKLQTLLYTRGPLGLRGLERGLAHISRGAGYVDRADLDTVLGFCGVGLREEEASAIFRALDRGDAVVGCAELVHTLRPPLTGAMEAAVREVYDTLEDPTFKTGAVEMEEVLARYRPGRHPRVMEGAMTEGDARRELEDGLEGVQGAVMAKDLLAFYADVVAGYQLDEGQLEEMLRGTWGLSGRS